MSRFTIVNRKIAELPPLLRAWFLDETPEPVEVQMMSPKLIKRYWRKHGTAIVEEFASKEPGRRPDAWWKWNALEPRQRLGGIGTPACEVLAYAQSYDFGIPSIFVNCDDNELPFHESEASFLKRHGLFLPGEEDRLPSNAYDPEEIAKSRIVRLRSIEELNAEHEARRQKGTLGKFDARFDK